MVMSKPFIPSDPVPRAIAEAARERLKGFPVLTITGPRQSGKTTLSRLLLPDAPYFSLEDPDVRAFATEDPRAFLRQAGTGAIFAEVQRVPELFSYLQGEVDAAPRPGRFILTGSTQFKLVESITQSLAGRSSMLTLLPFPSRNSTKRAAPREAWTSCSTGGFSRRSTTAGSSRGSGCRTT